MSSICGEKKKKKQSKNKISAGNYEFEYHKKGIFEKIIEIAH